MSRSPAVGGLLTLLLPALSLAGPITSSPGEFRDLTFGTLFPGVNESVSATDGTSAKWVFTADPDTTVDLTFTVLPSAFVSGPNSLTVTYGSTSASWNTTDNPATATVFDPAVGTTATLGGAPASIYIWLGGTAQPAASQPAGTYSETVTLDVSY